MVRRNGVINHHHAQHNAPKVRLSFKEDSWNARDALLDTFSGKFTCAQLDTTNALPTEHDEGLFEKALESSGIEPVFEAAGSPVKLKKFRGRPSRSPSSQPLIAADRVPRPLRVLHFGLYNILTPWYDSPFPAEYLENPSQALWICEYCLKYMRCEVTFVRHAVKCAGKMPPGNEIYREGSLSLFEVNGKTSKIYCQNLCLLAKMFLDHKTLYYDVDSFLFYILIEWIPRSSLEFTYSFVGYFSKEKLSSADYNLSCILILPHHQRKGYGIFLIDFSNACIYIFAGYLLSRKEGKLGTPEKPLSELGLLSYVGYWKYAILKTLFESSPRVSIKEICSKTGMTENDVLATMEYLRVLRYNGKTLEICLNPALLSKQKPLLLSKPEFLRWLPPL